MARGSATAIVKGHRDGAAPRSGRQACTVSERRGLPFIRARIRWHVGSCTDETCCDNSSRPTADNNPTLPPCPDALHTALHTVRSLGQHLTLANSPTPAWHRGFEYRVDGSVAFIRG